MKPDEDTPGYWTPALQKAWEEAQRPFRQVRLGSDTPQHSPLRPDPPNSELVVYLDDSVSMIAPAELMKLLKSESDDPSKWDLLVNLKLTGKIRGVDWDHRKTESAYPPKMATLLVLLIPKKNREHILGDLDEEYRTILLPRYGMRTAQLWYWWQVGISVGPLVWAQVKRAVVVLWLWNRVR